MNETIVTKLDEEFERTLEAISNMPPGTEEAKWQLTKLCEIHKQRMNESELKLKEIEASIKEAQFEESKTDRIIRIALDAAGIIIPALVSSYWMARGLRFEQTGTFTSRTGQWLSNHLRLFRK